MNPYKNSTYYAQHAKFIVGWIDELLEEVNRSIPFLDLSRVVVINNALNDLMQAGFWEENKHLLAPKAAEMTNTLDEIWPGWPTSCKQGIVSPWGVEQPCVVLGLEVC